MDWLFMMFFAMFFLGLGCMIRDWQNEGKPSEIREWRTAYNRARINKTAGIRER